MTAKLRPEDYRQMAKEINTIALSLHRSNIDYEGWIRDAGLYIISNHEYLEDALSRLAVKLEEEQRRENLEY